MRILALIPGTIGNQILFFPTLDTLQSVYPDAKIDVVVEPRAMEAYKIKQAISEVFAFDYAGRTSLADWGNLLGIVRDREYDLAIAPQLSWGLSFLLWLSGIPTRIGFSGSPGANFLTATVSANPQQYSAATYHDLLMPLGVTQTCGAASVNLPKADIDWADGERKRLGLDQGGYIVIYSVDAGYPANNWESILQDVQKKQPNLALVLLQDSQNSDFSAALKERISVLRITQPKTIGQKIAFLAGASLVICTEGDLLQAAIVAQPFTLGLFGSGDPEKIMPNSDRCLGIKSLTGKIADITPSMVLEKLWQG